MPDRRCTPIPEPHRPISTRGRLRSGAALAVIALIAAACGGSGSGSGMTARSTKSGSSGGSGGSNTASAPGITASSVTIGSHQPLTGPAAPGYSEIAPASNAFFQYVNAKGGVNGRKIIYKYLDDGYNPANTATVVRRLVLQDNVYAIFDGLGTPTHEAVEAFLNSEKVPDLFVASGCDCWNQPTKYPETFGYQTDYTIEGKVLGKYIVDHYQGKKVGYLYQNDDFGGGGVKGLDQEIPKSDVVSRQPYDVTTLTNGLGNQVGALKAAGAQVVALDTIPAGTALTLLAAAEIGYHPQWVVSSVGADPFTLDGLLANFSKGKAGSTLADGLVTSSYLPSVSDLSNPWTALFKKIHDQYDASQPFDGNTVYGMSVAYTFVQTLQAAGRNPTRADLVNALEQHGPSFMGPGLVPFGFSATNHLGYLGEQVGVEQGGKFTLSGPVYMAKGDTAPLTTYSGTQPSPPSTF